MKAGLESLCNNVINHGQTPGFAGSHEYNAAIEILYDYDILSGPEKLSCLKKVTLLKPGYMKAKNIFLYRRNCLNLFR